MDMSSPGKAAGRDTRKPEPEKLCGLQEADNGLVTGAATGIMGTKESADSSLNLDSVTIDAASSHCKPNLHEGPSAPAHSDSPQSTRMAPQSFSKPCPPECGTGALSSGVRPSRHTVATAYNARPRPATLVRKYHHSNSNFSIDSAHCKQIGPRGPPLAFS